AGSRATWSRAAARRFRRTSSWFSPSDLKLGDSARDRTWPQWSLSPRIGFPAIRTGQRLAVLLTIWEIFRTTKDGSDLRARVASRHRRGRWESGLAPEDAAGASPSRRRPLRDRSVVQDRGRHFLGQPTCEIDVAECLGRGAHSHRAHVRRVRIARDEVCELELEQPESRILRPPTKPSVDRRRRELDERALVNGLLHPLWSRLDIHVSLRMRHNSRDASSAKIDQ